MHLAEVDRDDDDPGPRQCAIGQLTHRPIVRVPRAAVDRDERWVRLVTGLGRSIDASE